jgi:hypothetical protein
MQRLLHLRLAGSIQFVVGIFEHKYVAHIPVHLVAFHRDSGTLGRISQRFRYTWSHFTEIPVEVVMLLQKHHIWKPSLVALPESKTLLFEAWLYRSLNVIM